jgi:hypothetical protein
LVVFVIGRRRHAIRTQWLGSRCPQLGPSCRPHRRHYLEQAAKRLGKFGVRGHGANLILPQIEIAPSERFEIGWLRHERRLYIGHIAGARSGRKSSNSEIVAPASIRSGR